MEDHINRRADRIFQPAGLSPDDLERLLRLGRTARARAFSGVARAGIAAVKGLVRRQP